MRVTRLNACLEEGQRVLAGLDERLHGVERLAADGDRKIGGGERGADRFGDPGQVGALVAVRYKERWRDTFSEPALRESLPRAVGAGLWRDGTVPPTPDPGGEKPLQRDRARSERQRHRRGLEGREDASTDLDSAERLLLGLEREVPDAPARDGDRAV